MSLARWPAAGQADELREIAIGVGADDEVHPRHLLEQRGPEPLGHAAHHAEDVAGPLVPLQLAHPADHPLLGVVADGAGVDQHDVGLGRVLGADVARRGPRSPNISSESATFIWQP